MRLTTIALTALLPLVVACGAEDPTVASDPALDPAAVTSAGVPDRIPAADGPVRTAHLATVLDDPETGPELCLGPVAESLPPQCSGVALAGWSWRDNPMHEKQGEVRWGSFAVSGTWDGQVLTVTEAIPAALYDVPADASPVRPTPAEQPSQGELAGVAEESSALPGHLASSVVDGVLVVDVVHDDGSLQVWADQRWGVGVVLIAPQLTAPSTPSSTP